jgi:ABC-2 type transport system permease protein
LLISVFLPILLLFLYAYGVSLDMNHLRIGLVLEDTAPDVQSFTKSITDSRYFDVTMVRNRDELGDKIVRGDIRGFIVIPSYFTAFRHRSDRIAPIQVIGDASEPNTANFVQNYAQGVFQNWMQQELLVRNFQGYPLINPQPRYWYNEELESRYFLLSGALAIIMTLIGTLLTAMVVSKEWERGTMESMMSTPVGIVELVLGKLIPYFVLGMVSMGLCAIISVWGLGLPMRGSWAALTLISGIFLFTALGFGLLVSTLAKNQMIASQISLIAAFLPCYVLSGFLFEIYSMPIPIQLITYLVPAKYFVQCLQTIFLVGNVWPMFLYNMAIMTFIGAVFLLLVARKTVKRLD